MRSEGSAGAVAAAAAESGEQGQAAEELARDKKRNICHATPAVQLDGEIRTGPGRNVGRPPCCMACGVAARRVPGSQSDRLPNRQSDMQHNRSVPVGGASQTPAAEPVSQPAARPDTSQALVLGSNSLSLFSVLCSCSIQVFCAFLTLPGRPGREGSCCRMTDRQQAGPSLHHAEHAHQNLESAHMRSRPKPNQSPHDLPDQHAHWLTPLARLASQSPRHTCSLGRDKQPMQPARLRGQTAWQRRRKKENKRAITLLACRPSRSDNPPPGQLPGGRSKSTAGRHESDGWMAPDGPLVAFPSLPARLPQFMNVVPIPPLHPEPTALK